MLNFRQPFAETRQARKQRAIAAIFAAASLGVLTIAGLSSAAHAELRGLVIGIDKYPGLGPRADLAGAVNDAIDVATSLRKAGSSDVTMLVNQEANKAAIETSWKDLVARSAPGDTLVFSYAGHGSQEKEPPNRHGEKDGKNENFILGGFKPRGPMSRERIIDDEIFDWLKLADDKGIRVVFVADSCHSGTMYRDVSLSGLKFRNVTIPDISEDELKMPPAEFATATPSQFRHVTFVGATEESRKVPEIPINKKPRGALSYSFSRAIEGGADDNKDGKITQNELISFLLPEVQSLVEGQQSPQVLPVRGGDETLIETRKIVVEKKTPAAPVRSDILQVAVVGGDASFLNGIADVAFAADPSQANVVWNVKAGTLEHVPGGLVAEDLTRETIVPVLGKWSAIKWLETHASGRPGQFILHSGNQRYKPGQEIVLSFKGAERPYLTLFNLAPNGRVEFFVAPQEVKIDWRNRTENWRFKPDKPPFGAEHLLAIFTDEPLLDLHGALKAMTTADRAVALRSVLEKALKTRPFQFGKASIYTGEKG